MTEITVHPAEGGRVRKPDGSLLAAAGESVVLDTYWRRRLDQGDVLESEAPVVQEPAEASEDVAAGHDAAAVEPAPAEPDATDPVHHTQDAA